MSLQGAVIRSRTEDQHSGERGERELLARVGSRDVGAFERLYRLYEPRLARFLATMLRRPQLVEEVLDDTMMVVWQSAGSFRGASKLSTWIFAIAYRKAIKARLAWPDPVEDDQLQSRPSLEPGSDQQVQNRRVHDLLIEAMGTLSAEHRAVVDLTYFHEMGYREIAEIVGCPVDTVKTRMFHARRRLRQVLPGDATDWI